MDYKWHYDQLITTRKNRERNSDEHYEYHHVLPKSMGGLDDAYNRVYLTPREHFIAHWLLWRIYRNKEMAFAFLSMCQYRSNSRKLSFSSIAYEEARIFQSREMSKIHKGKIVSDETRKKLVNLE